jgi:lysozyme family protein
MKTVKNEGYLSNHKDDKGGMTWKGIARNIHPNWAGWKEIDKILKGGGGQAQIKVNRSIEEMVQTFYFNEFWKPLRCQEIIVPIKRNKLFDTAVNIGIKNAVKIMQRSMLLEDNGILNDEFIKNYNK